LAHKSRTYSEIGKREAQNPTFLGRNDLLIAVIRLRAAICNMMINIVLLHLGNNAQAFVSRH
jgi:hypothetical protein